MPRLLERMGVECICINCEPTGEFAHNPEPLPANLVELSETVKNNGADLGISVDPDVDRLALICEDGQPFGEEYTLVSVADYLMRRVYDEALETGRSIEEITEPYLMTSSSNLSSTRALRDVTEQYGGEYFAAAVGEVNVTTRMKECGALIGGEGNGGVIYPALHYGRDAMVGVALFLTNLAYRKMKVSELLATYPKYEMAKNKIELSDSALIDRILDAVKAEYASEDINTIDGVKISFEERKEWVHLRRSNTEPIIRIYAEAATKEAADALAQQIIAIADSILK
jgi:phosphomannomutase